MLQLIPERIIKLDWGGAQCASHYIIEVNDSFVNTTNGTSYNYMIPPNEDTFIFTVRGVNYTGNVFTSISKTLTGKLIICFLNFILRIIIGPICSANPILADNGTLFITIKVQLYNCKQLNLNQFLILNGKIAMSHYNDTMIYELVATTAYQIKYFYSITSYFLLGRKFDENSLATSVDETQSLRFSLILM